jgi:hypothetical protein
MISRNLTTLVLFPALLGLGPAAAGQTDAPFSLRPNTQIAMPDGAKLSTDLYLPKAPEKFPAVLIRTPYDKKAFAWLAQPLAANGYAVVVQDVRGQGASEGEFESFIHERADGLATLDWIAGQTWASGRVALWGTSYLSYAGLLLAASGHPSVVSMVSLSGWGDVKEMIFPGGALQLMVSLGWNLAPQIAGGKGRTIDWPSIFRMVPVSAILPSLGLKSGSWGAVEKILTDPKARSATSIRDGKLAIPILHVTGWNDFLSNDTLAVFAKAETGAQGDKPSFQKLIVGPWVHDQIWTEETRVAEEDYGPAAKMGGRKVVELTLRWFDFWMKGRETGITREPRVRYFLMGANKWVDADSWPPLNARPETWFLESQNHANSSLGDGTLERLKPSRARVDRFTFDPLDPVPTVGGANFHHFPEMLGPRDQRPVEKREDVLVYTSPPLTEDLHIAGPIEVELYVTSSGPSTDFTAKLVEVRRDGNAIILADGIRRLERGTIRRQEPIRISLGQTAALIPPGSRLRLEVSSSNFPKYSRNPNTGEIPEDAKDFRRARQQVHHGGGTPSRISLSVVRRG